MVNRYVLYDVGFTILNIIRGLNIIALLCAMAASLGLIIRTAQVGTASWEEGTRLITLAVSAALIFTEIDVANAWIYHNFPMFGYGHGFVALGLIMLTMGTSLIAAKDDAASAAVHVGLPFWQLLLAAGGLNFAMGWVNLIATFIWRSSQDRINARMIRKHGSGILQHASDTAPLNPQQADDPEAAYRTSEKPRQAASVRSARTEYTARTEETTMRPATRSSRYSRATHADDTEEAFQRPAQAHTVPRNDYRTV